jgi:hypothetical protein
MEGKRRELRRCRIGEGNLYGIRNAREDRPKMLEVGIGTNQMTKQLSKKMPSKIGRLSTKSQVPIDRNIWVGIRAGSGLGSMPYLLLDREAVLVTVYLFSPVAIT